MSGGINYANYDAANINGRASYSEMKAFQVVSTLRRVYIFNHETKKRTTSKRKKEKNKIIYREKRQAEVSIFIDYDYTSASKKKRSENPEINTIVMYDDSTYYWYTISIRFRYSRGSQKTVKSRVERRFFTFVADRRTAFVTGDNCPRLFPAETNVESPGRRVYVR